MGRNFIINDEIPPDDILEGSYKLRIGGSEKLKTVLELCDLETHQKKIGPDYHRLKTMVQRSIEQDLRNRNFGPEMEIMRATPWSRIREQNSVDRILGDCWQWEANGQCPKGDNCSFRHDVNKRGKVTPSNPSPKKSVENPKSQRKKSQWQNVSMALQGLPQRNLQ